MGKGWRRFLHSRGLVDWDMQISQAVALLPMPSPPSPAVRRSPLPHDDLVAGELIAWRVWRYKQEFLASLRQPEHAIVWAPGEPMTGDPKDFGVTGVYAWKSKSLAISHLIERVDGIVGSVWLWGTVIEHEHGYRAEFASVRSIDYVDIWAARGNGKREKNPQCFERDDLTLRRMRDRYGVGGGDAAL